MFSRSHSLSLAAAILSRRTHGHRRNRRPGIAARLPPTLAVDHPLDLRLALPEPIYLAIRAPYRRIRCNGHPYSIDKDFVKSVAESSATEVQIGKLAQDKASSDAVKDLGKRMVESTRKPAGN